MELVNQLRIGVGIDTGRYGHRATFLRPDRRTAAEPLDFGESPEGYEQLAHVLKLLQSRHADCQVHVHIDAAGQYAENLQQFLRGLQPAVSVSVGEPKRNKDYHAAISPKRKTDATESYAMARFAVAESPVATSGLSGELLAVCEVTSRLQVKVRDATRAANRLHNLLARVFPELANLAPQLTASWVLTDVAMGHCMRKLLHLVFAVWKTNKPFDPNHHRWEDPAPTAIDQATPTREDEEAALEADGHQQEAAKEKAVGHNRDISSDRSVVTTASDIVDLSEASVKQADAVSHHHSVDYQFVRSQITLERMLEHLGLLNTLRPAGAEMRGPCPLHARADKRRRDFSVNLKKNVFCCFHPSCEARGNQLDLWAKLHDQTIFQAAQDLIETFSLSATRTEKRSP